jgi:predicted phosphate transport protein (TIGR00153 family)
MKLDLFIQKLLPHDDRFYILLEESANNIVHAAELLRELSQCKNDRDRERIVGRVKELEHRGDDITHRIFSELNSTFVTPFDREDIHKLTSSLDDILDHIDGSAGRFTLYKIRKSPPQMVKLIEVLYHSIVELNRAVGMLRHVHLSNDLQTVFQKVHQYENDGDSLFEQAVADLFEKEKNPVQIIKLKEIFVGLETATDKCEDAANVIEGILIKHA